MQRQPRCREYYRSLRPPDSADPPSGAPRREALRVDVERPHRAALSLAGAHEGGPSRASTADVRPTRAARAVFLGVVFPGNDRPPLRAAAIARAVHDGIMSANVQLGEFLRTRRGEVSPESVGLAATGSHRRVAGLRREEVAQLAGVSTDYYTRLEQGRHTTPSTNVLDAIAGALRLDGTARRHLTDLARSPRSSRRTHQRQQVRPGLLRLMETLDGTRRSSSAAAPTSWPRTASPGH